MTQANWLDNKEQFEDFAAGKVERLQKFIKTLEDSNASPDELTKERADFAEQKQSLADHYTEHGWEVPTWLQS